MKSRKLTKLLSRGAAAGEFLELAKAYQSQRHTQSRWGDMIEYYERQDCGCSRVNVAELSDAANWSTEVLAEGRSPRIAMKIGVNQRGNLVITHNSSADKIVFFDDFSKRFWAQRTMRGKNASPDPCNLMWIPVFNNLRSSACMTQNPIAQSFLAAFHVRIQELVAELSQKLTIVATSATELMIDDGTIIDLAI